jgi:hypothetical protein
MKTILIATMIIGFSTVAMASLPAKDINYQPTQSDINDEVSALIDAQNQQQYDQQQLQYEQNRNNSAEYSNCPNCPQS